MPGGTAERGSHGGGTIARGGNSRHASRGGPHIHEIDVWLLFRWGPPYFSIMASS